MNARWQVIVRAEHFKKCFIVVFAEMCFRYKLKVFTKINTNKVLNKRVAVYCRPLLLIVQSNSTAALIDVITCDFE